MKRIAPLILMIFAIALTAYSAFSNGSSTGSSQSGNELSTASQLVVGTLQLEGTEQEITAEQAGELVTLWYVYDEISQSDIAAQEEIDGLLNQIQESMTAEQLQAIEDMQLTQQDVSAATQGLTTVSSSSQSSSDTGDTSSPGGDMAAGAPSDGGMPGDFGGMQQVTSAGQDTTAPAVSSPENSIGVSTALVEALIQSLEQKLV